MIKPYHKIQSIFKRDTKGKFILGHYSTLEIEYLKDLEWIFEEKIDGTNIRIEFDGTHVNFNGRTDAAQIPPFLLTKLQELFPSNKLRLVFPDTAQVNSITPICLYGEGYGARIQKGGGNYIADGVDFILFDIRIGDWWLKHDSVSDIAEQLGIQATPCVGRGTLQLAIDTVKFGMTSTFGNFQAEGIVARPIVDMFSRSGARIITKVKCKDFSEFI